MMQPESLAPAFGRDQLIVVCDPGDVASQLRARHTDLDVTATPSYLAGIAALAAGPTVGLVVGVDPNARKLESALTGLRKAAGQQPRIVLCCHPSGEPAARRALPAGANDYLIYPPGGDELDRALGIATDLENTDQTIRDYPTWDELGGLADVLAGLADDRSVLLEKLCRWVADAMRCADVRIIIPGRTFHVGQPDAEPALAETITIGNRRQGKILIGPRLKAPYEVSEIEKLRHYSQLIGHILTTADQQQRWQSIAFMDEVTGLPNRRYLFETMGKLLQRAARERFRLTVIVLDLDGFKHFNDTYGHAAGDQILLESGHLFRKHCRKHDIVARYGGDEFVIVFWDADQPRVAGSQHPRDVLKIMQRIQKDLQSHAFPKLGPEATGVITVSAGLATYPWDAGDVRSLIDRADEALLQAKRAGKNRIYLVGSQDSHESTTDAPQ